MFKKYNPRVRRGITALLVGIISLGLIGSAAAFSNPFPPYNFATPVFGLSIGPGGSLLVADAGAGIVELSKGGGRLIAELPGVADIAPIRHGGMFAITGIGDGPLAQRLFSVFHGKTREIANLFAFESEINPDGGEIDSNPFDVAALSSGMALVADAGGNSLLIANRKGRVDWVATFPEEPVSTDNIKSLVGCPDAPPDFAFICDLPPMIPAQAVPTSVAIGPDGAFYVGELKGFPAPTGASQIWRIEPGTRHAECGSSPACTVVASGFTSIVDLTFGPDGTLYVVELDEASWAAVEFQLGVLGGTVNGCDVHTWQCSEVASGLTIPTAAAVNKLGRVFVVVSALIPGAAEVITLP